MTIIIFIIILAVLVLVHELGHFLVAKASGIRVDEFGLGFPPRIVGIKRGETIYSLNWIPFGGFVKIFGEDPDEESTKGDDSARSFVNKPKTIQALVLVAGIVFNILFAWLLISIGFMSGMPVPQDYSSTAVVNNVQVTVTAISKGSPAEAVGLKTGDILDELKSGSDDLKKFSVTDVQNFITSHPNQAIDITYSRGGATHSVDVTPATGIVAGKAAIGVELDPLGILKLGFFGSFIEGAKMTWYLIDTTAVGLGQFIGQAVIGHAHLSDVTGPVGIAGMVGDARALGFIYLLTFVAFISINLAIINLIPFPALDGGRLLFVLIEKIKGSPINSKIANTINTIGFALIIILMLVVTYHDIMNLFVK